MAVRRSLTQHALGEAVHVPEADAEEEAAADEAKYVDAYRGVVLVGVVQQLHGVDV